MITGHEILEKQAKRRRRKALIAAAPDMLEALEKVLRIVEPLDDPQRWGGCVCKILRDAIAKAEGVTDV